MTSQTPVGSDRLEAPADPRFLRSFVSLESYAPVIVLIIITYGLLILLERSLPSLVVGVQALTVVLTIHVSRARRGLRLATNAVLVFALLVAVFYFVGDEAGGLRGLVFVSSTALYLIAPFAILRAIASRREVDREALFGAVAAYLLIGMFFAFLYLATGSLGEGNFFGPDTDESAADYLFFSFTTLTTTGFGNLVPAANPGQTFAVIEMLIGQLFLITAVGKVISAWRPRRWAAAGMGPSEGDEPQLPSRADGSSGSRST